MNIESRRVALTFDDGPSERFTGEILDTLAKSNVKATFFLIGKHCLRHPRTALRISGEGHAIGNHSYAHSPFTFLDYLCRDAERARQVIRDTTGVTTTLYRPPYGLIFPFQERRLNNMGMKVVRWSVNSYDYLLKDQKKLVNSTDRKTGDGDIVLLHDGRATGSGADRVVTSLALPQLISRLQDRGFQFCSVEEILASKT